MKTGFFPPQKSTSTPSTIARCGQCGLHKGCNSPRMQPTGEGLERVLIVAEAPGAEEDKQGIQLVGKSGQRLRSELEALGWNLDRDCWKTNVVICRPPNNEMHPKYVEACRPNLNKTIDELNPEVIILLGGSAVKSLIPQDWAWSLDKLDRWVGWRIPSQRLNTWICPTYHPSYLERVGNPVLDLWFRRYLKAALDLKGRPWGGNPRWEDNIDCVHDVETASLLIRAFIGEDPIAFDLETDRLKPDHKDARIVSCAVSDGKVTVAYPWVGEAVGATSELLGSRTPKIGWNIKFEQRWSERVLGHRVRNWIWDGMVACHTLDNRRKITSAKFQSFVQLGLSSYDSVVKPYLEDTGKNSSKNAPNRIRELDLNTLLEYNGMDALVEFKIAEIQRKEMGFGE